MMLKQICTSITHIRQNSVVATVTCHGMDNERWMPGEGSEVFEISCGVHLASY
jgi:hypothetical protein